MIDFDFHVHSNYSSCASQTVSQAIQQAYAAGINTIALCDHNCIEGLDEAQYECNRLGMTFVNGVEISAEIGSEIPSLIGCVCHMLGYAFSNYNVFNARMDNIKQQYLLRLHDIADYLYKKRYLKYPIIVSKEKELRSYLVESKTFHTDKEAKAFLHSDEVKMQFPQKKIALSEAIQLIHDMHGLAVLAHPCMCENHNRLNTEQIKSLTDYLIPLGLDGVELFHEDVLSDKSAFNIIRACAEKHNLCVTLGSDRHHITTGEYFKMQPILDTIDYDYKSIKNFWRIQK